MPKGCAGHVELGEAAAGCRFASGDPLGRRRIRKRALGAIGAVVKKPDDLPRAVVEDVLSMLKAFVPFVCFLRADRGMQR
jgi:hypothetical protein